MIIFKFLLLGFFTALLFPPFFILPLGFVIFPFLYKLILKLHLTNSFKLFFFSGFVYAIGLFSIYLIWIQNPFYIYDETKNYAILSFLLIIFISFIFGIFFILFKYINNFQYNFLYIPLILIVFEIFISNLLYGFPWFSIALILSSNKIGSILLYLFGTHLTGVIIIIAFLTPQIIKEKKELNINYKVILSISVFFLIVILFFYNKENNQEYKKIKVDLFQTNHTIELNNSISKEEKYDEIKNLIQESDANLLIFGENNYPYLINNIDNIRLGEYLKNNNQTIIIGAIRKENNNYYNSFLLIQKNNIEYFDKKILVPFGEFVPFRNYLKFIEKISGPVDFALGDKNRLMNVNNQYTIIPVICYEIIFFWKLLNKNNNFADILVNITNDSWFGSLVGPYQHFYLSKMRASELNKILLRVSTNGISGIIKSDGSILKTTKLNQKTLISTDIKIYDKINLNFIHKIYSFLLLFIFIIFLHFSFFRNR